MELAESHARRKPMQSFGGNPLGRREGDGRITVNGSWGIDEVIWSKGGGNVSRLWSNIGFNIDGIDPSGSATRKLLLYIMKIIDENRIKIGFKRAN
jgi:hypothetical protein